MFGNTTIHDAVSVNAKFNRRTHDVHTNEFSHYTTQLVATFSDGDSYTFTVISDSPLQVEINSETPDDKA